MKHLRDIGCTEVLFAFQENHINVLNGAVRFGAKIAKDNGLSPYVVIWGYANTFGGGKMSHIMLKNIDMWRVKKDGSFYSSVCLNNPKTTDNFIELTEVCRTHGFQGIFIDEPTFPRRIFL